MKISNETKIGTMAVVGIVLLVLGFNFLKGNNLFKKNNYIYAKYQDVQGLSKSNPVVINGLQVGRIENLDGGKSIVAARRNKEQQRIPRPHDTQGE